MVRFRRMAAALTAVGLLGAAVGCGQITTPATYGGLNVGPGGVGVAVGQSAGTTQTTTPHVYVALTIMTGKMIGKPGYPEYVPADFTVPAHALVTVTIRDFDDGPAPVPASNLQVQGTVGGQMTVVRNVVGNVGADPGAKVSALAANDVAHTFTVPSLNLNVPIPPSSTVTFTFQTGNPGTYAWQCFAPCGTGSSGWAGAMATNGYMKGTITVQA